MKKSKKKRLNSFLLISLILISIIGLFYFGFSQNVLGVRQVEWQEDLRIKDGEIGSQTTEGILTLPTDTELFSLIVYYDLKTNYYNSIDGIIDVKYEIFNYDSNSYELLHSKTWNIPNPERRSYFRVDGGNVYSTGIPEKIVSFKTAYRQYDKYYGCLPGMTVQEAKELNPWIEGSSTYTYKCMFPGDFVYDRDYDNEADEVTIEYFPELKTFDSKYVSEGKAKLKIYYNVKTRGFDDVQEANFNVQVVEVKTPIVDTYFFEGDKCNYQAKYTYQVTETDYYTKNECEYNNGIIQCYLDSQCNCTEEGYSGNCEENVCSCEKDTWFKDLFPDKEEPIEEEVKENNPYLIPGLIFIGLFLGLIILLIVRLRRK